jgi:hypothetical protein
VIDLERRTLLGQVIRWEENSMRDSDRRLIAAALQGRRPRRREVLRGMAFGAGAIAAPTWLTACSDSDSSTTSSSGEPKRGGSLRMGGAGGGSVDTIDAHKPTSKLDIARVHQLYEPLMLRVGGAQ